MPTLDTYTPRDGDIVHLRADTFNLCPAGRYTLREFDGRGVFDVVGMGREFAVYNEDIAAAFNEGWLTPIDPAELERDRKALELRSLAPLRGRRNLAQHDVDGLALFDAHRAPQML